MRAKGYSILERPAAAPADRFTGLRRDLDRAVRRAQRHASRQRMADELPRAVERGLALLFVLPVGLLVLRLLWALSGAALFPLSVAGVFFAIAAPYVLFVAVSTLAAGGAESSRTAALEALDARLGMHDRLTSADDFLSRPQRSSFMAAALEDARGHVGRALTARLALAPAEHVASERAWLVPLAGAIVTALAMGLPPAAPDEAGKLVPSGEIAARSAGDRKHAAPVAVPRTPPESQLAREPRQAAVQPSRASATRDAAERDQAREEKRSEGMTKQGETASAGAPSGSAAAKGQPTSQGKASKPTDTKRSDKKPKEHKQKDEAPGEKKEVKESSGATMSRGAAGGATKNPVASDWSSKDEVQVPEDEPLKEDEPVEDDESAEQARGGLQPNLRDRRPPPNRELSISFGNRPGGEGRGGPSGQKKSRGTASLVFGVPVPDHVRGRLNPGTTKVTQERVEPRPEQAEPVAAGERARRDQPSGIVPQPRLSRSLRDLLKIHSLRLRSQTSEDEKGKNP
jgi:hypothetical protein